ncbi:MAG: hypothetical protein K1X81_01445 [Bacteroidia bacterium]|nr:hypothetical protein [Bacteroidia bacterium]
MKRLFYLFPLLCFSLYQYAQTVTDYRCQFFNEKMQRMNFSDSVLNLGGLLNAKEISAFLGNKKDPKQKVTIQQMTVTINRVRQKMTEFEITGNRIMEGNEFYDEFKLCVQGDKIYIDHIVYKTASGEVKSFNKGFVFVLK